MLWIDELLLCMCGCDIMLFVDDVLWCYCDDGLYWICGFMLCVIEVIYNYWWFGNVWELINWICFVVVMMSGLLILVVDFELYLYMLLWLLIFV